MYLLFRRDLLLYQPYYIYEYVQGGARILVGGGGTSEKFHT